MAPSKIPKHWGKDGGDPKPPCEFAIFASTAFGPIPPGQKLGYCDKSVPTTMYIRRPHPRDEPQTPEQFKVCSTHRGFASETQAQQDGNYSIAP